MSGVITHGVVFRRARSSAHPILGGGGDQAAMVASRVAKGVALVLSAAVATTVRTSASPLAAHTSPGSRSSPCAGPRPVGGRARRRCSSRPPCRGRPRRSGVGDGPAASGSGAPEPDRTSPGPSGCHRGPAPARAACAPGSRPPTRSAGGRARRPCRAITGAAGRSGRRWPRARRPRRARGAPGRSAGARRAPAGPSSDPRATRQADARPSTSLTTAADRLGAA